MLSNEFTSLLHRILFQGYTSVYSEDPDSSLGRLARRATKTLFEKMLSLFGQPRPPAFFTLFYALSPCEIKSYSKDVVRGSFRKKCGISAEQSKAGMTDLAAWKEIKVTHYLSLPLNVQHDPIREVVCLQRLKNAFGEQTKEMFPVLMNYELNAEATTLSITTNLATLGTLAEYYGLDDSNDDILMLDLVPGDKKHKLSVLIRIVFSVYALNFVADIAHNDLNSDNILMDSTEHAFVKMVFLDANNIVQSVVVPTYGVKPIVCDFGMATQFATTYSTIDDFDHIKYYLEGPVPVMHREERVQAAEVVKFLLHLYALFVKEDPLCVVGTCADNTCIINLTNKGFYNSVVNNVRFDLFSCWC